MAKLEVSIVLDMRGPILDGTARGIIRDWLDETKRDIAQRGVNELHAFVMDKSGRATGRYQSEIVTSDLRYGDIKIHDPVVYGPWLEGTSKRNRSTRFKGYRLWRLTAQKLQDEAPKIAEARMPELISRLGGGGP